MKTVLLSLALAATLTTAAAADIQGFATGLSRDTGDATLWQTAGRAPDSNFGGEFYTTPDNCTYRRTQAPGYAPSWILIVNPYHLGKPNAHRGCPGML